MPWWLLNWVNANFRVCWTHVVLWKMYGSDHQWSDLSDCDPDCYCGKYMTEETRTAISEVQGQEVPF